MKTKRETRAASDLYHQSKAILLSSNAPIQAQLVTYTINQKLSFSALMHQYTLRTPEVADLQGCLSSPDTPLYHALLLVSVSPFVHVVFGTCL
jgi:hypothetical protein